MCPCELESVRTSVLTALGSGALRWRGGCGQGPDPVPPRRSPYHVSLEGLTLPLPSALHSRAPRTHSLV